VPTAAALSAPAKRLFFVILVEKQGVYGRLHHQKRRYVIAAGTELQKAPGHRGHPGRDVRILQRSGGPARLTHTAKEHYFCDNSAAHFDGSEKTARSSRT
jgi:hypothetical protein